MADLVMANLPLMSLPDDDIYGPVQRAQQFKQQQNALIQQQQQAARQAQLRNYLAQSIDPTTGRTNYNQLYGAAPVEFRPDIQGLQNADLLAQAELGSKRATGMMNEQTAMATRLKNIRDLVVPVNDQASWDVVRPIIAGMDPSYAALLPQQFTPEAKNQFVMSADEFLKNTTPKLDFQETGDRLVAFDVTPGSPTFTKRIIDVPGKPRSPGVTINTGARADTEFGKTMGQQAAKRLDESLSAAESARTSYGNTENLYQFVNSRDFISGSLADTRQKLAKFLNLPGVNETDTYFSQIGNDVAETIKKFGAGTGLSDNDRKYAEKIAGGSVELNAEAIRRIMFIRQNLNRNLIKKYNETRGFMDKNNPQAGIAGYYQEIPVPPPPSFNAKGWALHQDKNGNYAYVSPDGKMHEETQ